MAYLWQTTNDDQWAPTELYSAAVLGKSEVEFVTDTQSAARHGDVLLYRITSTSQAAKWALLSPAGAQVQINASPLETGIRALIDRDAIRLASLSTMYFSTERLARIEPFPEEENIFCPRDKSLICAGDPAVCCPQCGVWYHEHASAGKACWTYAETCALCEQPTDLDSAAFRWTPEEL